MDRGVRNGNVNELSSLWRTPYSGWQLFATMRRSIMFWVGLAIAIIAVCAIGGGIIAAVVEDSCMVGLIGMLGGGFIGFFIAAVPLTYGQTHYNERTITCDVTGKDRGGSEDGMRVYTSCGTFQNTDSLWRGKNTSADLWSRIQVGNAQTFTVVGWRFGLTSDFPNILEVK